MKNKEGKEIKSDEGEARCKILDRERFIGKVTMKQILEKSENEPCQYLGKRIPSQEKANP